jgi:hypothetical protein
MKGILRVVSSLCFLALLSGEALAQQAVAPLRKPAADGRSLAETMSLIQKELNAVGKLSFVVHIFDKEEGNGISKYIEERGKVVADPATCAIRYHWWRSMHGDVVNDEDVSFRLHDVLGLSMMTNDQHEKLLFEREKATPDEKQTYHLKFDPQVYLVILRMDGDNEEGFTFVDRKQADRVAQAMGHAVELCGGKNVPF